MAVIETAVNAKLRLFRARSPRSLLCLLQFVSTDYSWGANSRKQEELMQPRVVIAHAPVAGLGSSCLCDWGTISRTSGLAGACSSHRDGIRAEG